MNTVAELLNEKGYTLEGIMRNTHNESVMITYGNGMERHTLKADTMQELQEEIRALKPAKSVLFG